MSDSCEGAGTRGPHRQAVFGRFRGASGYLRFHDSDIFFDEPGNSMSISTRSGFMPLNDGSLSAKADKDPAFQGLPEARKTTVRVSLPRFSVTVIFGSGMKTNVPSCCSETPASVKKLFAILPSVNFWCLSI